MIDPGEFLLRVGLLVVLALVVAFLSRRLEGGSATPLREYAFLFSAGIAGAIFGALNDSVTSRISPDYFELGKGIAREDLPVGAIILGAQAGFAAGAVGGAILLVARTIGRRAPPFPIGRLVPFILWILVAALAGELVLGSALGLWLEPPAGLRSAIGDERTQAFVKVWALHIGVYAGAAVGVVGAVVRVARRRLSVSVVNVKEGG
ncbi:MAG TPA: hypothetical protein VK116_15860 [Planctomycetota bacterium]|nr:hypothetical protein [Planctomycetota bacterium]